MSIEEQMKLDMTKELAVLLMDDYLDMTIEQALFTVLNSDTYTKLLNDKTCFYYQSPRYVYDFLKNELKTGKIS